MPTIQVEAHVSGQDLLKGAEQLEAADFQRFVADVLSLRARRLAPSLPGEEVELLQQINQGLPNELRQRYDELVAKRRAQTLTPTEYAELQQRTDEVEQHQANRLGALTDLAQLRRTSLDELMTALGVRALVHE